MMLRKHVIGLSLLVGVMLGGASGAMLAQTSTVQATENESIFVGEIIEILPLDNTTDAKYGWILVQDSTQGHAEQFLQGGTSKTFRYRPIQPGNYTLYGDISKADGSLHIQRTFHFSVKTRTSPIVPVTASGQQLVTTDPPLQDGTITLDENTQLVRLLPISADQKNIALDGDTVTDSNGDGNPANDVDNANTFFQSDGLPLYVWFANPPLTTRAMTLTAAAQGGGVIQNIQVVSHEYAKQNNLLTSAVHFTSQIGGSGTVVFAPALDASFPSDIPLIYRWTFGDGQESLETQPTHKYVTSGTYGVLLQVRNLSNGKEVGTSSGHVIITIAPPVVQPSSTASVAASSAISSVATTNSGGGIFSSFGTIFIGILVLIVSLAVGMGLIFLLSKLRKGSSLDQHLAKMEENILKKEKAKTIDDIAPLAIQTTAKAAPTPTSTDAKPMQDSDASEALRKRAEAEIADTASTSPTPTIDANKAPAWLKKGLGAQDAIPTTATPVKTLTPTPAPKVPTPPPAAPKPTPVPVPTPAAAPVAETLPTWLQPQTTTPDASPPVTTPVDDAPAIPDWMKATPVETPKVEAIKDTPAPQAPVTPVKPTPAPVPTTPVAQPVVTPVQTPKPATLVTPPAPKPQEQKVVSPSAQVTTPAVAPTVQTPATPKPQEQKVTTPVAQVTTSAPTPVTTPIASPTIQAPAAPKPPVITPPQTTRPAEPNVPMPALQTPVVPPKPQVPVTPPTPKPVEAPKPVTPPVAVPVSTPQATVSAPTPIVVAPKPVVEAPKPTMPAPVVQSTPFGTPYVSTPAATPFAPITPPTPKPVETPKPIQTAPVSTPALAPTMLKPVETPKPMQAAPVATPVVTPADPKLVEIPKPVTPPVAVPVSTPQATVSAPTPIAVAPKPVVEASKPTMPAPVVQSTPFAPITPPAPKPVENPKPMTPPIVAPQAVPVVVQTPAAVTPAISAPTPASQPKDILPAEEPIAFIRAESLNPPAPQPPKA